MGLKRVMWFRRYQGQCRALRPLGHQGYRLCSYNKRSTTMQRLHVHHDPGTNDSVADDMYTELRSLVWNASRTALEDLQRNLEMVIERVYEEEQGRTRFKIALTRGPLAVPTPTRIHVSHFGTMKERYVDKKDGMFETRREEQGHTPWKFHAKGKSQYKTNDHLSGDAVGLTYRPHDHSPDFDCICEKDFLEFSSSCTGHTGQTASIVVVLNIRARRTNPVPFLCSLWGKKKTETPKKDGRPGQPREIAQKQGAAIQTQAIQQTQPNNVRSGCLAPTGIGVDANFARNCQSAVIVAPPNTTTRRA